MISATHCKEVSVRVLNDIGILAQLTRIVADKGVNLRAAAAWVEDENKGIVRLVTDDNLRAMDALRAQAYQAEIESGARFVVQDANEFVTQLDELRHMDTTILFAQLEE